MINVTQESLIAIRDVPRHLPLRPNGKCLHVSAVYRWILRGVHGVILEAVRLGGSMYTSREALQRFADRLSPARPDAVAVETTTHPRQRDLERAAHAVMNELGLNGRDNGYDSELRTPVPAPEPARESPVGRPESSSPKSACRIRQAKSNRVPPRSRG